MLAHRVSLMDDSDPYRAPTQHEKYVAAKALSTYLSGKPNKSLLAAASRIGITATSGVDSATGRKYKMLSSETDTSRSWGEVIVDRPAWIRQVIEIPHPKDDLNTWILGINLYRKMPGSVLVVAGSSRHAGTGADVAHNKMSIFQVYGGHLARHSMKEVQIHGFANSSLPGVEAIPSPGPTTAYSAHAKEASKLVSENMDICKGWVSKCGDLRGTKNVQGTYAKYRHSRFLHIETSKTARENSTNRAKIVNSIASTWY